MSIGFAPKNVCAASAATDRPNFGLSAVSDPTCGALEMSPDLELKAREAISRELRRIKFRLYLSFLFLYFEKLSLQARHFCLRVLRKIAGNLF